MSRECSESSERKKCKKHLIKNSIFMKNTHTKLIDNNNTNNNKNNTNNNNKNTNNSKNKNKTNKNNNKSIRGNWIVPDLPPNLTRVKTPRINKINKLSVKRAKRVTDKRTHKLSSDSDTDSGYLSPSRYRLLEGRPPATIEVPSGHFQRTRCHGCDCEFRWKEYASKRRCRGKHHAVKRSIGNTEDVERRRHLWDDIGDARINWQKRHPGEFASARYAPLPPMYTPSSSGRLSHIPYYRIGDKRELQKCPLNCEEYEVCNLCSANEYKYT